VPQPWYRTTKANHGYQGYHSTVPSWQAQALYGPRSMPNFTSLVRDLTGHSLSSHFLHHLANKVRDLLVHCTVLLWIGKALATKFLLDSVKAFIQIVSVVATRIAGWSGIHGGEVKF